MEHPEVHTPVQPHGGPINDRRDSPIFVPVVKGHGKLVRRGHRQRRRLQIAGIVLALLLVASFAYAFVVERQRENVLRLQSQ